MYCQPYKGGFLKLIFCGTACSINICYYNEKIYTM